VYADSPSLDRRARRVRPQEADPAAHHYPAALSTRLAEDAARVLSASGEALAERFVARHRPRSADRVRAAFADPIASFRWAGVDLVRVREGGETAWSVIETNSSPSGQKSVPPRGGYEALVRHAFLPLLDGAPDGVLAVLWDKNPLEVGGYAAATANVTGEAVYAAPWFDGDRLAPVRTRGDRIEVHADDGWKPVRAAIRYVTQRPWRRIPRRCATRLLNPIDACLAGGRNKAEAERAYAACDVALAGTGLRITRPRTAVVDASEVMETVRGFGGLAAVKVPYANAGQGVYTIDGDAELRSLAGMAVPYERMVVQELICPPGWRDHGPQVVGTRPDAHGRSWFADLRVMLCGGPGGLRPAAAYARRARRPLGPRSSGRSADMLVTNLSIRHPDGRWDTDTSRLIVLDDAGLAALGIDGGDLVDAVVLSAIAVRAIDARAEALRGQDPGVLGDPALARELLG
jgi:hypothetical protein